jgi:hypothetical protein
MAIDTNEISGFVSHCSNASWLATHLKHVVDRLRELGWQRHTPPVVPPLEPKVPLSVPATVPPAERIVPISVPAEPKAPVVPDPVVGLKELPEAPPDE